MKMIASKNIQTLLRVTSYNLLFAGMFASSTSFAAPAGGKVVAGHATISTEGDLTRIQQTSDRAIINWRNFGSRAQEGITFQQPSKSSATLNRVTGDQVSVLLGTLDANGRVLLVNPNGIIFGAGSKINVASLIASTSNISNENFLAGQLIFDEPGKPGASVVNEGMISASDGGLVALVAPHVRNDGLIEARLGKVMIGAADSFTIDLYGDGLVNLALSADATQQLLESSGTISADGGEVVLISAAQASDVLDDVINMSGVIRADSVEQQSGKIVLHAAGGQVTVDGQLSASGAQGGSVDVLGESLLIASHADIDVTGEYGGGTIHVGGDYQGQGDRLRSQTTHVEAGAQLDASALTLGDAGDVVVWSDGFTEFAGSIRARGGSTGGDGGQVEVSGKQQLSFSGQVDAGATNGDAGSLLLDPAVFNVGLTEAALINRVLRTGTDTSVSASDEINVNSAIDGRGRFAGGGLALTAGNDVNVNDFIITNDGAIDIIATSGTVTVAAGKAIVAGNAPISITTGGDLSTGAMLTSGGLNVRSTGGAVTVGTPINAQTRSVAIRAAQSLTVDQPILSHSNGSPLSLTSDSDDVILNAQIDGRGGVSGGQVSVSAGGGIMVNESVITQDGAINMTAQGGTISVATDRGLFAGNAPITAIAQGDLSTGAMITAGTLSARSATGDLAVDTPIGTDNGNVSLSAAGNVAINQAIVNIGNGSDLTVSAEAGSVTVDAQIDGRNSLSVDSGTVQLNAGTDVFLNESVATQNGAITVVATSGTVAPALSAGLFSGEAPILVTTGADLHSGVYATTGDLSLRSTGGAVNVDTKIDETIGNVSIQGQTDVNVNVEIANLRSGSDLSIVADTGFINIDAQIDALDDLATLITPVAGGAVTLSAEQDVNLNENLVTFDGAVTIAAASGAVNIAASDPVERNKKIITGSGPISISSGADFTTGQAPPDDITFPALPGFPEDEVVNEYVAQELKPWVTLSTTGDLSLTSTGGSISIDAPIPYSTGAITLNAFDAIDVRQKLVTDSKPISLTAGSGGITIHAKDEQTYIPGQSFSSPEMDARAADLTLLASGDISILDANGVASTKTISITSTDGAILQGVIGDSAVGTKRPENIFLEAALGIGTVSSFYAGRAGNIEAHSVSGPIRLGVFVPGRLRITTDSAIDGDIFTGGFLGPDVILNAGHDINLSSIYTDGPVQTIAGNDIFFDIASVQSLQVASGRHVNFDFIAGFGEADKGSVWMDGGPLSVRSTGGDIRFNDDAAVHITGIQDLDLHAYGKVELRRLETLGAVDISTQSGDIILHNDIGPSIIQDSDPLTEDFDPAGAGVASLSLTTFGDAFGDIIMEGARASGDVAITTNFGVVDALKAITSTSGTVTISAAGGALEPLGGGDIFHPGPFSFSGSSFGDIAIGVQAQLAEPGPIVPAIPPGPQVAPPAAPPAISAIPPDAPSGVDVDLLSSPGAIALDLLNLPPTAAGAETDPETESNLVASLDELTEIIPGDEDVSEESVTGDETQSRVVFDGGSGLASGIDFGQSGSFAVMPPGSADSESDDDCEDGSGEGCG